VPKLKPATWGRHSCRKYPASTLAPEFCGLLMQNYALVLGKKPIKVGGLHGGRTGRLVNIKGIMALTAGCRIRIKRRRMAAHRSRWKRTDSGGPTWAGSRDGDGRAQPLGVGRSPVKERIRGRIQGESLGGGGAGWSASDAVAGKWGVCLHQR